MHALVPVKSIYGFLIPTPTPTSIPPSTGTFEGTCKMRTLFRKENGIQHLLVYISVVENDQDRFQKHGFKCTLTWPKRLYHPTIVFSSERLSNKKQTLHLTWKGKRRRNWEVMYSIVGAFCQDLIDFMFWQFQSSFSGEKIEKQVRSNMCVPPCPSPLLDLLCAWQK